MNVCVLDGVAGTDHHAVAQIDSGMAHAGGVVGSTKPENIKDFYRNNELIDLTRELTEMLRKNRTIDWQKKETARASMRKMVKHLLKKYKYPPEDYDTAISTVISQCEMWTDNITA